MPYVYSPPNWLYQKGSDTRTKTASGNTASSTALSSFSYDGFNRLATSVTAAETTTYTYNALGQRIKKINQNGLSTVFHYGPNGELLYERDANGNTKVYVWLDGRPLARIDNDAQIYYYHVDHLGTPQAMTNQSGATVWKADYEPFGKAAVKVNTVENNLRFPGQYYDRETGLHYNYFRDYDPGTGRYVEADPIGLEGGMNIYGYVGGNPVGRTDPLGLYWWFVHELYTQTGAERAGMNPSEASDLGAEVAAADFAPHSQDGWASFMHAMCSPGLSTEVCQKNWENYIRSELNKCTKKGLARAIHALQDSYAGGHGGFQQYTDVWHLTYSHFHDDAAPTQEENVGVPIVTENIIRQWQEKCTCKK